MGRPLYSTHAYAAPIVQVREEPEPQPQLERWSYLNQFDPDSDEFFANAEDEWVRTPELESDELTRNEEASRGMVEEVDSSEASSSGRGTPTEDDDGLSVEELEVERRRRVESREGRPADDDDGQTYRAAHVNSRPITSYARASYYTRGPGSRLSPVSTPVPRAQVQPEPATTRSNPIPIPAPARPVTPPNNNSYPFGSPSPPPSVTPRLYNWAARGPLPAVASPSSPLPNRGARRSVAHITSSPVARIVY